MTAVQVGTIDAGQQHGQAGAKHFARQVQNGQRVVEKIEHFAVLLKRVSCTFGVSSVMPIIKALLINTLRQAESYRQHLKRVVTTYFLVYLTSLFIRLSIYGPADRPQPDYADSPACVTRRGAQSCNACKN